MMDSKQPLSLIKPPKLKAGDTIGIVAPSFPLLESQLDQYALGKHFLQTLGFVVKEGKTLSLQRWWSAGTALDQAADLNDMFANPEVRALVALCGGFSAFPVLDLLDYQLIRNHPKPFLGMSDNTLYHWALLTQCSLVGFHVSGLTDGLGAFFQNLTRPQQEYMKQLYLHILTDPLPIGTIKPFSAWEVWRPGNACGRLLGGNLKRFATLIGTRYFPPLEVFDGALFFWEEIGESIYDIWLNLYKLKHLGLFQRISGMIIGKLPWINYYFTNIRHPSPREAVLDVVGEFHFPILANVDFGHRMVSIPMPIGILAEMDAENHQLNLQESPVL